MKTPNPDLLFFGIISLIFLKLNYVISTILYTQNLFKRTPIITLSVFSTEPFPIITTSSHHISSTGGSELQKTKGKTLSFPFWFCPPKCGAPRRKPNHSHFDPGLALWRVVLQQAKKKRNRGHLPKLGKLAVIGEPRAGGFPVGKCANGNKWLKGSCPVRIFFFRG